MEQRAGSGGNGFILLGAKNAIDNFQASQFYIYFNNRWTRIDLAITDGVNIPTDTPKLIVRVMQTNISDLNIGFRVEFLPTLGSQAWDIVDFVQSSNGFQIMKKLTCQEDKNPKCQ